MSFKFSTELFVFNIFLFILIYILIFNIDNVVQIAKSVTHMSIIVQYIRTRVLATVHQIFPS